MSGTGINLHYGNELVSIAVPVEKLSWIASPNEKEPVTDMIEEIRNALDNPIGMPPLEEIINGRTLKTAILIDDFSRPTPAGVIVPEILERLRSYGINDEDITIIVALGTHRYMTDEEIKAKLGEGIPKRIKVINHYWKDEKALTYFGDSPSGIPIHINKNYKESELSIAIGNIVPHIYAGWAGGAKMIQPGISGAITTAQTHLVAAKQLMSIIGNVENPVRHDMELIARQTGLTMIVNTVMNPSGGLVKVVAGDLVRAHRAGVAVAEDLFTKAISVSPDLVITSAYPADCDLWQSTKAMTVGAICSKKGGTVILLTPSPEGDCPGHPDFVGLGSLSPDTVFEMTQKGIVKDVVAASVNMTVGAARERASIIVVTEERNKPFVEKLGLSYAKSFSKAMELAEIKSGRIKTIGIITHGGEFAPKFNQAQD